MNRNHITINHVTYDVQRVFSGNRPISRLLIERLRNDFPSPVPLTGQGDGKYNGASGSILSEEVL